MEEEESSRCSLVIIVGIIAIAVVLIIIIIGFLISSILRPLGTPVGPDVRVVSPTTAPRSPFDRNVPSPHVSRTEIVRIYLVALGDNGTAGELIGCGDSLVPVERRVKVTTFSLRAAFEELLSLREQFYREPRLYNALYQSDLVVESLDVDQIGTIIVRLTGTCAFGGTCDVPRFEGQIVWTIQQFPDTSSAQIFIKKNQ